MNQGDSFNLTIYIASHKKFDFKPTSHFQLIQVNGARNPHFTDVTDDTGDNISLKNNRYSELTALYWIWKNDSHSDYVGLCHYRRYFKLHKGLFDHWKRKYRYDSIPYDEIAVSPWVENALREGKVFVTMPMHSHHETIGEQYCRAHVKEDFEIMHDVLGNKYPEYLKDWDQVMNGNHIFAYNMSIMSKERFDDYCSWLFGILFAVEEKVPPKEDTFQNRTFGFMSERLFNVYLQHQHFPVVERPYCFINDLK